MAKLGKDFFVPQVGVKDALKAKSNKGENNKLTPGQKSEFNEILGTLSGGVKVTNHAAQRLMERKIDFSGDEFLKVNKAIDQLKNKGGNDALIITGTAAYIVDVQKNKLVTAVDRDQLKDNVFTNIDSTILVE
jgi:flagellar operon protein